MNNEQGKSTAALVLGISSCVAWLIRLIGFPGFFSALALLLGIVMGIIAIVFAIIALSGGGEGGKGAAITGLVLGILNPILGFILI